MNELQNKGPTQAFKEWGNMWKRMGNSLKDTFSDMKTTFSSIGNNIQEGYSEIDKADLAIRGVKVVTGSVAVGACVASPCGIGGATMAAVGAINIADGMTGLSTVSESLQTVGANKSFADGTAGVVDILGGGKGQIDNIYSIGKGMVTSPSGSNLFRDLSLATADMAVYQKEFNGNLEKIFGK